MNGFFAGRIGETGKIEPCYGLTQTLKHSTL
jgi:hypothetical protein